MGPEYRGSGGGTEGGGGRLGPAGQGGKLRLYPKDGALCALTVLMTTP